MELFRSILYVPGAKPRALARASQAGADALVLDLEDAVAPAAKTEARRGVAGMLQGGGFAGRRAIVRINGLDTPWGRDDLEMVRQCRPEAVLVPKVESAEALERVRTGLGDAAGAVPLWAMLETPLGVLHAEDIARHAADRGMRLSCLVLGLNDLSSATCASQLPGRVPMLPWLSGTVLVARAYGLPIVDGVFNDYGDERGLRAECEQARHLGFDGKSLIHPAQVAVANAAFAPSREEIAHARAVIRAFEAPGAESLGAIGIDGRMVERLHLSQARRVLALSAA
ncbi:(3S)-malyl-CoA thioesterase [Pigmentiphaga humi]|uniref:(3S)-malyl-CoA thioesterase n=1 Tax=Pigmentiphaga humi TaxID=2478468 RepID=A0A3P4B074_9BURK|nr:CoA ester lyase [Pigmentiphaga humi]VCU69241.1 (3S)-malyl-CoA thioesterase [Pigmentiphaga humi]